MKRLYQVSVEPFVLTDSLNWPGFLLFFENLENILLFRENGFFITLGNSLFSLFFEDVMS